MPTPETCILGGQHQTLGRSHPEIQDNCQGSDETMKQPAEIRILLVEDEAITALALASALQAMGYQISPPVATGEKALASLALDPVDVVLMDISLAGSLNGIETARKMMQAGHRDIIFITGYSCGLLYDSARALDPVAIFTKPVKPADLKAAIDGAVLPPPPCNGCSRP